MFVVLGGIMSRSSRDEYIDIQIKRMNFITSKLISHDPDDDYDDDDEEVLQLTIEDELIDESNTKECCSLIPKHKSMEIKLGNKHRDEIPVLGTPFSVSEIKAAISSNTVGRQHELSGNDLLPYKRSPKI